MPREVLEMDVAINPTQVAQQTEMAREMIAQGLSQGSAFYGTGSSGGGGGGSFMGGPYGGMSPYVPAFAPEGMGQTAIQAMFPSAFAPPYIPVDQYRAGLTQSFEDRFAQGAVESVTGVGQFGAEVVGAAGGAALFGALGQRYFGEPGRIIGGIAGGLIGGSIAREGAGLVKDGIDQASENFQGIQEVFKQNGFQAGMGSFLQDRGDFEGAMSGKEVLEKLASSSEQVVREENPELQRLFPKVKFPEITRQLLASGFQNNLFDIMPEQFGGANDNNLIQEFLERLRPMARATTDIGKAFQTSGAEALQIEGDFSRLGVFTAQGLEEQASLLSEGNREFGILPKMMLAAGAPQGSGMARQSGLSGEFGVKEIEGNVYKLAESRRLGSLDRETMQAGGGIYNLAASFNAAEDQQLGKGGYLRDLIMASTTQEGGLDSEKLKDLVGKGVTPLEARELANRSLFSSGDALKKQEEFNYNFRDLADQAGREVPGFEQAGLQKEIFAAAKMAAATTGREVTQAGIFQQAQRFGLSETQARAYAESFLDSPETNIAEMMGRGRERFDRDIKTREDSIEGSVAQKASSVAAGINKAGEVLNVGGRKAGEGVINIATHMADLLNDIATMLRGATDSKPTADIRGNTPTSAPTGEKANPSTGSYH